MSRDACQNSFFIETPCLVGIVNQDLNVDASSFCLIFCFYSQGQKVDFKNDLYTLVTLGSLFQIRSPIFYPF